jgi:tetratricopeptide (TPR) repeat protein
MRTRFATVVALAFALAACGGEDGANGSSGEGPGLSVSDATRLVELQNRGIGLLERYDYGQAVDVLDQAHAIAPEWRIGRLHLALACLHAGAETRPRARQMMEDLVREFPEDVHALFGAGILAENAGDTEAALPHFRRAYELSGDPVIGAKLGTLLVSLDLEDEAFEVLTAVHARRPALVSPVNALMLLHRRRGDEETAQTFYDKLIALKGEINDERSWVKVGEEIRDAYGNLGPYSLAIHDFGDPGIGVERPRGDVSVAQVAEIGAGPGELPSGAPPYLGTAALDYDADGDLDLFVCGGDAPAALLRNDGELRFTNVAEEAGVAITGAYAVAAGEIDVDPEAATAASGDAPVLVDLVLVLADGVRVLRNDGQGGFADVTAEAGLAGDPGGARAVLLFDADQEGDLDLFLAGGAEGGNRLYANRGPGVFVDVTADSGLAGDGAPYGPAVVLDADEDWDLDLLVTRPDGPPVLFLNDRLLRFTAAEGWVPDATDGSHGAVPGDFDRDGHEDVIVCGESAATWLRGTGTGFEARALPGAPGGPAVTVDPLLRGYRDLFFPVGRTRLPAEDGGGFGAAVPGDETGALANVLAADLDGDGAEDVVLVAPGSPVRVLALRAESRGVGLVLDFRGVIRNDVQAGWSNLEGRDAWVEVKAGPLFQGRRVGSVGGFGVAHPTRSVFGIGNAMQADFVRVAWPDAVQQGVLDVPAGTPVLIVEEQRRPDSCPLLFSWDGERFAWVTDFIGAGGLGFLLAPGVYAAPDPTESVKVPAALVAPDQDGKLAFKLVEAMEEIVYLDHVDLLVVDHPADVSVDPDERFTGERPFADGALRAHRESIVPVAARDGRGRDVLPHVLQTDRIYSEDPDLHPRLTGAIAESVLELDFGKGLDGVAPGDALVLYLDGWIEYGYTRTSVAAAGEQFEYVVPVLDVWDDEAGAWRTAVANLGYPAGFPRVMTYDVTGVLSRETPRVRIRTNLEIYWPPTRARPSCSPRSRTCAGSATRASTAPTAVTPASTTTGRSTRRCRGRRWKATTRGSATCVRS